MATEVADFFASVYQWSKKRETVAIFWKKNKLDFVLGYARMVAFLVKGGVLSGVLVGHVSAVNFSCFVVWVWSIFI